MPSRYSERLQQIALEEDSEKRLELTSALDADVVELDEKFSTRDEYEKAVTERDTAIEERDGAIAERDEWKLRYASRFFDSGEGAADPSRIDSRYKNEVQEESKPLGYAALWN